jgi:ABC-type Zn uptake system ZnuABC Zn-binding protein ZnuA
MPSGVCPAFYDTTPSDVSKIVNADIIISFGSSQMEPWLDDLLTYNTDAKQIKCQNMGEWNIPTGAKAYVEYLTSELSKILPEINETINKNSQSYLMQIDNKSEELKDLIRSNGFVNKTVICMSWQKDFIKDLGLNVIYSYGPPQGLSTQDELDVINAATDNDVCAVIDNLQSGTDFGGHVSSESGASHILFTNFPGAIPGTDTYLDMITYNTNQLIDGINAYEYKQGDISNLEFQISGLELQRNLSVLFSVFFIILALIFYTLYRKK